MNSAQRSAIKVNHKQLCNEIHVHEVINVLADKHILSNDTVQLINNEPDDTSKARILINLLQNTDDGWTALLDALKEVRQSNLVDLLNGSLELENAPETMEKGPRTNKPEPTCTIADPKIKRLQQILQKYIKKNYEIIPKIWYDILPETNLRSTYQPLAINETIGGRTFKRNIECEDYTYLQDETTRIILIEGDPGTGKSTYINKLAMDWANQHQLLNETFDFIVTVSRRHLAKRDWKKSIISAFGNEINADSLKDILKSKRALIILDGCDEYPMKKVLQEITAMHDSITGDGGSPRLLITTRESHAEDFKNIKNQMRLRILGFDEKYAISLIKIQLKNDQNTDEILDGHRSLVGIFQNPLYATMIAATELTMKLLEMEPQLRIKAIFDAFLKFQKRCYFNRYPNTDEEKYDRIVEKLGKYALKFLGWSTQKELREILGLDSKRRLAQNCQRWLHKHLRIDYNQQSLEAEWLKMGLVQSFKQEQPNEGNKEINFLHQEFAEYHAALYVAKHGILPKSSKSVRFFISSPKLFQSLVFALRKDFFVAGLKNGLNYVPSIPLPLDEMIKLLQSCEVYGLELHEWIIDEKSINKIAAFPMDRIRFLECDINLKNFDSNASFNNDAKVNWLSFYECKLAVTDFDSFYQVIHSNFPKLDMLHLWDNSDRRFDNGSGYIQITFKCDSESLQKIFAKYNNVDYLLEILQSPKIQNYYVDKLAVGNVRADNYGELFRTCQTTAENDVEWNGLISYLDSQFSFTRQERFKKLNMLELHKCDVTVEDIVAICSLENLSCLRIYESKLSENLNRNRTNEQILHLNLDEFTISHSDEILAYLAKNVAVKGKSADLKMSSIAANFTEHLFTSQRPYYFNEKLTIWANDDDVEVMADSIVSLLALSSCVQLGNHFGRKYQAEYAIMSHSNDDRPIKLILKLHKAEVLDELTKSLPKKLQHAS